ncbi:MAG TPA: MBL fold metallo-hydrolase [Pyrinomonadaceae bacterium]|jgi:L-ascorbate metabolism protein UlaG (beta-lactamase superfamily)|nr:MBL fold metallo-hydrolase [Pyrinomonadaceae bacterium]
MSSDSLYLKQNVLAEPLFNQWYAWSGLIAPATAAMFIANSHMKIMQSFVSAPQVHVSALKNPAMRGGPFINYASSRAGDIKALMEKTAKEQAHMLEFASAIHTVNDLLDNEAAGHSLEPLYQKVPNCLKGYVELVYDLHNHPSVRFIEGLLYKSRYYDTAPQSVSLSQVTQDDRPFALSTPQLGGNGHVWLNTPFNNPALDELFKMKTTAKPLEYIKDLLGVQNEDVEKFKEFFTTEAPPSSEKFGGEGLRVRYFGHACILFETKEISVLTDPVISYAYPSNTERYTYADLPDVIDYVVITHNHQDHCMFETLLQLRHKIRNVIVPKNNGGGLADPSLKLVLRMIGFDNVYEIDEMESISVPGGSITGLPFLGEHADLNIRTKIAYLVQLGEKSIVCAADSNNIEPQLYQHVHELIGDVDVVFIGMECEGGPLSWLYGPLLTKPLARKLDQSRRLDGSNCEKAMDLVNQLKPKHVYVYAMGQEPWLTYLTSIQYTDESKPIVESNKLVTGCRERKLVADRLYGCREIHCNN